MDAYSMLFIFLGMSVSILLLIFLSCVLHYSEKWVSAPTIQQDPNVTSAAIAEKLSEQRGAMGHQSDPINRQKNFQEEELWSHEKMQRSEKYSQINIGHRLRRAKH